MTPRSSCVPALVACLLIPSCGGGGSRVPSGSTSQASPIPSPSAGTIALTVVDGRGQIVPSALLKVDGVARSPRETGGSVFQVERSLVGHSLEVEREGFLVHQTFVPDRDRFLDLFEVPEGAVRLLGFLAPERRSRIASRIAALLAEEGLATHAEARIGQANSKG